MTITMKNMIGLYVLVENLRLYLESEEIQLAANGGELLPTSTGAGTEKPSELLPLYFVELMLFNRACET